MMHALASLLQRQPLLVGVGLVAVCALASVLRARGRAVRAAAKAEMPVSTLVASTLVTAAVITGVEWVVVISHPDTRTLLVVLAVPALLAGCTVGRVVAAAQLGRKVERGWRR